MNKSQIIEKVKKCLRLGASSNEHESANALRQAKRLMEKYQISDGDLALSDVGESYSRLKQRSVPPQYLTGLMHSIAAIMGCETFLRKQSYYYIEAAFVGLSPNDELAAYAFDTLSKKLAKARQEYTRTELRFVRLRSKKIHRADLYCIGWTTAIRAAVESLHVSVPEIVGTYMMETHPELCPAKTRQTKVGNSQATRRDFFNGASDGEQVDLNKPVSGRSQFKINWL